MVGFHLAGEIFLEPVVLLDEVVNEFYGQLPLDFDCRFAMFGVVEPCLGEPSHSEAVGVDAYCPWDVKRLNVNLPIGQWVNQTLTQYGLLKFFFFNSSVRLDRKIC